MRSLDAVTGHRYHSLYNPAPTSDIKDRLAQHPSDIDETIKERLAAYYAYCEEIGGLLWGTHSTSTQTRILIQCLSVWRACWWTHYPRPSQLKTRLTGTENWSQSHHLTGSTFLPRYSGIHQKSFEWGGGGGEKQIIWVEYDMISLFFLRHFVALILATLGSTSEIISVMPHQISPESISKHSFNPLIHDIVFVFLLDFYLHIELIIIYLNS